jgi:hypothetical protein
VSGLLVFIVGYEKEDEERYPPIAGDTYTKSRVVAEYKYTLWLKLGIKSVAFQCFRLHIPTHIIGASVKHLPHVQHARKKLAEHIRAKKQNARRIFMAKLARKHPELVEEYTQRFVWRNHKVSAGAVVAPTKKPQRAPRSINLRRN